MKNYINIKEIETMIGIEREEIDNLNKINLIAYLEHTDSQGFNKRNNGTLVCKKDTSLVIYSDHSYNFGMGTYPYKDNIGTRRYIYKYNFMEAVNHLREFQKLQEEQKNRLKKEIELNKRPFSCD